MKIIYADNNATTAVAPEVLAAMAALFTENYFIRLDVRAGAADGRRAAAGP